MVTVVTVSRLWAGRLKNHKSIPWMGKRKSTDEKEEHLIWNNRFKILWLLFLLNS